MLHHQFHHYEYQNHYEYQFSHPKSYLYSVTNLIISINYGAMVDVEDDDDAFNQARVKYSLYFLKLQYHKFESKFV